MLWINLCFSLLTEDQDKECVKRHNPKNMLLQKIKWQEAYKLITKNICGVKNMTDKYGHKDLLKIPVSHPGQASKTNGSIRSAYASRYNTNRKNVS